MGSRSTQMQPSGLEAIVPICTPVAAVKKFVTALYSGFITLQEDAEQILNLANCMQVVCCFHMSAMHLDTS